MTPEGVGWVGERAGIIQAIPDSQSERTNERKNEKKQDKTRQNKTPGPSVVPAVRPFGDNAPARGRPPTPGIERKDDSGATGTATLIDRSRVWGGGEACCSDCIPRAKKMERKNE